MLPKDLPTLPKWAHYETHPDTEDTPAELRGHVRYNGQSVCVSAFADDFYPAILGEYAALYAPAPGGQGVLPDFIPAGEWPALLAELVPDDPDVLSTYWLETAHQTAKMDVQRVTGFRLNLSFHHRDPATKERFRQSDSPAGVRGAARAAGWWKEEYEHEGVKKERVRQGTDARQHYKRLRGFLVA